MSAIRLNAAAIAAMSHGGGAVDQQRFDLFGGVDSRPLVVSRRDVIKAAGIAATVATGALSARSLQPLAAPEVGASARAAWLRAGGHRAVLDPKLFAGSPVLTVSSNGSWRARLAGARFPGISVPAGIDLEVLGSGLRSELRLVHELGFEARVGLSDWLAGAAQAVSGVDLSGRSIDLGDGISAVFGGRTVATVAPDWSLRLESPAGIALTGLADDIVADALTIALAADGAASLLNRRIARRTVVTLESAGRTWSLPELPASTGGTLDLSGCRFGSIVVEAAETAAGVVHRALVARSASGSTAAFAPAVAACTALPVADVVYARLLDGSGGIHVAARFADEPVWVPSARHALLLGGAEWAPPFQMWGSAGSAQVSAKPAVFAVSAAFEGGIASPVMFPADSRVTTDLGDRKAAPAIGFNALKESGFGELLEMPFKTALIILPSASVVHVLRPDDLLSLSFEFYHMTLDTSSAPARFIPSPAAGGQVAVRFPGQHVLERAILDPSKISTELKPPLDAYLAGRTTLAFDVTGTRVTTGIEYSMAGLLNWTGFVHRTVPVAERYPYTPTDLTASMRKPAKGLLIGETPPETSIEMPWGMHLSPYSDEWWKHRASTFTKGGRTELWHTRLHGAWVGGVAGADAQAAVSGPYELPPTVRAVWAHHYQLHLDAAAASPNTPKEVNLSDAAIKARLTTGMFRNPFTTTSAEIGGFLNRWNIVDLSARFHADPISINNLMLTALGGWLDSKATWDLDELKYLPPNGTYGFPIPGSLIAWDHRATMGRDQYVKIVTLGYLFPFGHRAVELTITERRVDTGSKMAFLGQKKFIVVLEPEKTYSQEDDIHKRRFPFKRVAIKTLKTPSLKVDWQRVTGLANTAYAYWVYTDIPAARFMWQIEATDWDGKAHKFEMPLIWVKESTARRGKALDDPTPWTTLGACSAAMRATTVTFGGQAVALAGKAGGSDSSRVMPVNWMTFEAVIPAEAGLGIGDYRFHPIMYQANVSLDAIEELTNQSAGTTIRIADIYRDQGYGGTNAAGKVIASLVATKTVNFPGEVSGGMATPIPRITGISAVKGVFGGDETQFGGGEFDPTKLFDALNAELFGGISLVDLIKLAAGGLDLTKTPVFQKVTDSVTKTVEVSYDWSVPVPNPVVIFVPDPGCALTLRSVVRKSLEAGGPEPSYEVTGTVGPFKLVLLPEGFDALHVSFGLFTFRSVNGSAPQVTPDITGVEFGNDLKYLAKLAEYMGGLGGSGASMPPPGKELSKTGDRALAAETIDAGPFRIDISSSGVKASLTIAIPDLAIGVFSLKNMSVSMALTIPFTGDPVTLDFGFCSREAPFELLVMIYGGGGYCLMTFDVGGMRALEIGFEFGAGCAFGIGGVASGHVEVKGGLSVRYERLATGEKLEFRVYIRIQGSLDILGLISVTLTFYLELAYRTFPKQSNPLVNGDELTGTATLTIEIEIAFFSIPVKLSVTKTLAGDDPRFGDMIEFQSEWDDYCAAFAPAVLGA